MIKFFRRIRQQLVSQNKFSKYMLYAIGEIILVVIGILIALQINNLNEAKKTELMVHNLFEDVLDELAINITRIDSIARFYEKKDSLFYLIMGDKLTYDNYAKNEIPELNDYTVYKNNVHLSTDAYKNLVNDMDKIPLNFKPILKQLNYLNNVNKDKVDQKNQEINQKVDSNIDYENENFYWVANRSKEAIDKEIDYKLNSWKYKNTVLQYWHDGIGNLMVQSMIYRKNAVNCYQNLAKIINQPISNESFSVDSTEVGFFLGEWTSDQIPDVTYSHYLKDDRFFQVTSIDSVPKEWIYLSKSKYYNISDNYFATIWGGNDVFYSHLNFNTDLTYVFKKSKKSVQPN